MREPKPSRVSCLLPRWTDPSPPRPEAVSTRGCRWVGLTRGRRRIRFSPLNTSGPVYPARARWRAASLPEEGRSVGRSGSEVLAMKSYVLGSIGALAALAVGVLGSACSSGSSGSTGSSSGAACNPCDTGSSSGGTTTAGHDANPDGVPYPSPAGGYGRTARSGGTPGSVMQNFKFLGFLNGDNTKPMTTISLADYYDPCNKRYKLIHLTVA